MTTGDVVHTRQLAGSAVVPLQLVCVSTVPGYEERFIETAYIYFTALPVKRVQSQNRVQGDQHS